MISSQDKKLLNENYYDD